MKLIRELKDTVLVFLVGIPWGYLMCMECEYLMLSMIISGTVWVVLAKGNTYVSCLLDQKINWITQPLRRLIFGIAGHGIYTVLAVWLMFVGYDFFFDIQIGNLESTMLISVGVTFVITTILTSRDFLKSWRQQAVDNERMKKEAISAKYETLKNQVNPHFLFNSFNVLTELVYEDQDTAARFIKKLSEVYRYVLEARDKELVSMADELEFVKAYIFLQKIRHGESLQVNIDFSPGDAEKIAPMSIQMLLENSIKHNIISDDQPLRIDLTRKEGYIFVSNSLQKKNIINGNSAGVGLSNIKARYQFLASKPVIIDQANNKFRVGLPIIKANS
ncbi:MAG: histidine kinase [Fulvivirga sp.]|nr:histidine kinase [Fulvivirga sp.]